MNEKIDNLMKESCIYYMPSNEILYPLRCLYPKRQDFSSYRVHYLSRKKISEARLAKFINTCQEILDELNPDQPRYHHKQYYLEIQKERFKKQFLTVLKSPE